LTRGDTAQLHGPGATQPAAWPAQHAALLTCVTGCTRKQRTGAGCVSYLLDVVSCQVEEHFEVRLEDFLEGWTFPGGVQAIARQGCSASACGLATLENWGPRCAGLPVLGPDVRRAGPS
jgi:hypothetical protein